MKRFLDIASCSALLIGSIVGGGLATGREVMVYFGNYSPIVAFIGGLFSGILPLLFMITPEKNTNFLKVLKVFETIAAAIICIAMCCALNEAFPNKILIPISTFSIIISVFLATKSLKSMAYSNVIMVGIILILLIILSAKTTFEIKSNNLSVFVPLTYASMNVMLSSLLAKEIGKTHTKKQNLFISLITATVLAVLIVLVYFISLPYLENAFPMSDAAERLSLSKTYSIILYLSVFSTLLSSMKILNDNLSDYIQKARNKLLSLKKVQIMNINKKVDNVTLTTVIIILILCFTFQNFSFKDVVRVLYPPIGYLGLIKIIREVIVFVSTR